jgi:hypothetical protein
MTYAQALRIATIGFDSGFTEEEILALAQGRTSA